MARPSPGASRESLWLAVAAAAGVVAVAWLSARLARGGGGGTVEVLARNGKAYECLALPGAEAVAQRLADLEHALRRMMRKARDAMPEDPRLKNIKKRWNGTLREARPGKDIAYSVSKDAIYVCVRDADGSLGDWNTCMFVLVHELAHVATDEWGHPPRFWKNMTFLLQLAESMGYYAYVAYEAEHVTYCGRHISSSPLTCVKRGTCASQFREA